MEHPTSIFRSELVKWGYNQVIQAKWHWWLPQPLYGHTQEPFYPPPVVVLSDRLNHHVYLTWLHPHPAHLELIDWSSETVVFYVTTRLHNAQYHDLIFHNHQILNSVNLYNQEHYYLNYNNKPSEKGKAVVIKTFEYCLWRMPCKNGHLVRVIVYFNREGKMTVRISKELLYFVRFCKEKFFPSREINYSTVFRLNSMK
jgi:hypothetical protein